jgi:hypothetical protein
MKHEGLLKAKKGDSIYAYLGDDKYVNLTNGGNGKIHKDDASRLFTIPLCLNNMAQKNPKIIDLISELGMVLEPLEDWDIERINNHYSK